MKIIIDGLSNRSTHSGWAIFEKGSRIPLPNTFFTTRQEARDERDTMHPDLFRVTMVDKAKLEVVRA